MFGKISKFDRVIRNVSSHCRLASTKVGFIGLGNMGASMAKNLVAAKMDVMVFDLNADSCKKLAEAGAKISPTVKNIAQNCDVIITMLPATKHVNGVMKGPDGIFENAKPGTLIIDSSTIDPLASKALHIEANGKKLKMLDAPVSGGVTGAAAGTLTFMIGGDADVLESAKPIFNGMGKNIVHCGGPGTGGVTKLCNNLSLAISMIGTSEAMALGVRLGMEPAKLASVMNTSTARCWSSDSYNPVPGLMPNVPASKGYAGGFGSALMEKDLSLAMDAATAIKARVPLGAQAHQVYGLLCEHGYADKDFSVVYEFLSKSASPVKKD